MNKEGWAIAILVAASTCAPLMAEGAQESAPLEEARDLAVMPEAHLSTSVYSLRFGPFLELQITFWRNEDRPDREFDLVVHDVPPGEKALRQQMNDLLDVDGKLSARQLADRVRVRVRRLAVPVRSETGRLLLRAAAFQVSTQGVNRLKIHPELYRFMMHSAGSDLDATMVLLPNEPRPPLVQWMLRVRQAVTDLLERQGM
jgi:hypothetical protein